MNFFFLTGIPRTAMKHFHLFVLLPGRVPHRVGTQGHLYEATHLKWCEWTAPALGNSTCTCNLPPATGKYSVVSGSLYSKRETLLYCHCIYCFIATDCLSTEKWKFNNWKMLLLSTTAFTLLPDTLIPLTPGSGIRRNFGWGLGGVQPIQLRTETTGIWGR